MKNYTITVNGNSYEVTVEESTGAAATQPIKTAAPAKAAPVKPAPVKQQAGGGGAVKVNSPMPGKILSIKKEAGAKVKKGEVILVLEAMKMENDIVAPQDGTIASINVPAGASVEAGEVLATMN